MAKIYKLNINTLVVDQIGIVVDNEAVITDEDNKEIVSITNSNLYSKSDLDQLKKDYPHYDTYYNSHRHRVYMDLHRHDDEEVRVIVTGTAFFYIPYKDILYIAECSTGDKVKLQPNVDHWFSTNDELLSFRLYKENDSHVSLKAKASRAATKAHHSLQDGLQFSF